MVNNTSAVLSGHNWDPIDTATLWKIFLLLKVFLCVISLKDGVYLLFSTIKDLQSSVLSSYIFHIGNIREPILILISNLDYEKGGKELIQSFVWKENSFMVHVKVKF